jgi:hypothetical protein
MELKDSGCRREFSTGAVRDDNGNKGRCDLLPLEVVFKILACDPIVNSIHKFTVDLSTSHLYIVMDLFTKVRWGNTETMLLEVAKHFEDGARKYGDNNWQKGIPVNCYIDSALRHYFKYRRGDQDEPHDRAFIWNLMCCIWEVDHHIYVEGN